MTDIGALRAGLAANLATVPGLRVFAYQPDLIEPPMAVVTGPSISFDLVMVRGADRYTFTVDVFVQRSVSRTAQNALDAYLAPTGASSIKTAIESDPTLDGAADSVQVTTVDNYGEEIVGETPLLRAVFTVDVIA